MGVRVAGARRPTSGHAAVDSARSGAELAPTGSWKMLGADVGRSGYGEFAPLTKASTAHWLM